MKYSLMRSLVIGAAAALVFVVITTIAGELYKVAGADGKMINPIKDFLKGLHGHHWVGKGIWTVIAFGATSLLSFAADRFSTLRGALPYRSVAALTLFLILGTFALYGFFTVEYLINH